MQPLRALTGSTRAAQRGPRPPALVCLRCDATIVEVFDNPLLAQAKALGLYQGETTGGVGSCDACLGKYQARREEMTNPRSRTVVDMPARERDSRFANFETRPGTKPALERARAWLEKRGRDFYLFGPTGTGKTRLALTMANEALDRRLVDEAIYVRVPTLIRRIRESFNEDHVGTYAKISTYVSAPLLILDDLAAENGTPFTRTTIESLYNDRIDVGRPTLITSNLPLGLSLTEQATPAEMRTYRQSLGDFLGDDRMTSRIAGNADVVEIGGNEAEDYRLRRRKR